MMSKNVFFLIFLSVIFFNGCSKPEQITQSKIKIFGAALLTGNLAGKANNGLILYGRSNDGKTFTKKINDDVTELQFPNGVWNFYAVAWEYAGGANTDSGLMGKVSCAKSLGVQLTGVDISINLTLSNNGCDTDFHPDAKDVGSEKKLANFSAVSCKSITPVGNFDQANLCDSGEDNKGYATAFKIVVPEYANFTAGGIGNTQVLSSRCFRVDTNAGAGISTTDSSLASSINMPKAGNGFEPYLKVYYSYDDCDEDNGFTTIQFSNSTKKKSFVSSVSGTQANERYFIEADSAPICQGNRIAATSVFASGKGTPGLPFTICNKTQFENINLKYNDATYNTNNKSFELLADLNLQLQISPGIGSIVTPFTGNFNGRNHRIENFRMKCTSASDGVGFFNAASNSIISDLTINRGVVECDSGAIFSLF